MAEMIRVRFQQFFDRDAVTGKVPAVERKVLSKAGAFVRTRARSSIRRRKKVSAPGSPPSSHSGELKKWLFFGYERESGSVVIGPAADYGSRSSPTVPELLEFGGTTMRRGQRGKARKLRYRARPFMGPALEAEAPKFPGLFADTIKR